MITVIKSFVTSFDRYSIRKNIALSNLFKLGAICVNLAMVPMLLDYLGSEKYGIWLTISSVLNWFIIFDFGTRHGLRNKLTIALSNNDTLQAKQYISSSYVSLVLVSLGLLIIFLFGFFTIDISRLLNLSLESEDEINIVVIILFCSLIIQFIIKNIDTVLAASHKTYVTQLLLFINVSCMLIGVYYILETNFSAIIALSIIYAAVPIVVFGVASIVIFKATFNELTPQFRHVQVGKLKEISKLGLKFFILQITAVILFSTDNLIIAHYLSGSKVSEYNIVFKYFQFIQIPFTIIGSTMWSAYTEAYEKKEFQWIKKKINQILIIWFIFSIAAIIFYICSSWVFSIWIGNRITFSKTLTLYMMTFVILNLLSNIYSNFLNGIGDLNALIFVSIVVAIINIPLSIYFLKNLDLGSGGVILSTIVCVILGIIVTASRSYWILQSQTKLINESI